MTLMKSTAGVFRRAAVVSVAAVTLLASSATAQTAGQVLQKAVEAARGLQSVEMKAEVKGAGGFAGLMPVGSATVKMVRARDEADFLFNSRVEGSIKDKADAEGDPVSFVTWRSDERSVSLQREEKLVTELSGRVAQTPDASLDLYVTPWELATRSPYEREMNADSVELEGSEEIDGETVDVLMVKYPPKPRERGADRTPLDSFNEAKWYIARSDGLPRRVERIAGGGGLSFSLVVDYSEIKVNPGLTPESIAIETPEGFRKVSRLGEATMADRTDRRVGRRVGPRRVGPAEDSSDGTVTPEPATEEAPAAPAYDLAPEFSAATVSGDAVTRDSLNGQVSVLYFWGTWCIPCRQFSPLVSNLVDTFEGEPVGVYGLAVRERNADAPADYIAEKGYKHTLLLGEPGGRRVGADAAARAFRVRVYPSIVVLGGAGELVGFWRAGGSSPAEIVGEVEEAVRGYLADHTDKVGG